MTISNIKIKKIYEKSQNDINDLINYENGDIHISLHTINHILFSDEILGFYSIDTGLCIYSKCNNDEYKIRNKYSIAMGFDLIYEDTKCKLLYKTDLVCDKMIKCENIYLIGDYIILTGNHKINYIFCFHNDKKTNFLS